LIVAIIALIAELFIFIYIVLRIKKSKQITLQDTAVYPFLLLVLTLLIFYAKIKGSDADFFQAITFAFNKSLKLITASIESDVVDLMKDNKLMLGAYYFGCVISFLSVFSISLSLLKVAIKNVFKVKLFNKELNYIFNLTDEAKTYIKGLNKEHRKNTVLVLQKNNDLKFNSEKLFSDDNKIKYLIMDFSNQKSFDKTISKLLKFHDKHKCYFVLFSKSDEEIYNYAMMSKKYVKDNNMSDKRIEFILNADNKQANFIDELLDDNNKTYIPIRTFNKHELAAFDFISKHNLAKYYPKSLLNKNCTIKDCDINLFVFGFGKINQAVLKNLLIETQFINESFERENINVEVYDIKNHVDMFNLSNGIFKYRKNELNQEEYLDLPDDYYSHTNFHLDYNIESINFMSDIKKFLEKKNKPQVNYFLISFYSDFENSIVAKKILDNINNQNYYNTIFVRTKSSLSLANDKLISFGDDCKVYTYDNVIKDSVYFGAKRQSLVYAGKELSDNNIQTEWCKLSKIKQQNNLYAVMSVPFKLSLMGFDEMPTKEEFFNKYDPNNERSNYTYLPNRTGLRDVIAYSEHARWNALEMSCGVLPLKKKEAYNEESSTLITRTKDETKHLCITSQKGLYEYYDFITAINKKQHQDNNPDVVKYDYDLMDNLYN